MRARIFSLPLLATLLLSCSTSTSTPKPAGGSAPRTKEGVALAVAAADGSAASWRKREGQWSLGDRMSTYTAFLEGGAIRLIVEELNEGPRGTASIRYYFDPKGLYYYIERRKFPAAESTEESSEVRLAIDEFGGAIDSLRLVNGKAARLSGDELPKAMAHADELRRTIEGR